MDTQDRRRYKLTATRLGEDDVIVESDYAAKLDLLINHLKGIGFECTVTDSFNRIKGNVS